MNSAIARHLDLAFTREALAAELARPDASRMGLEVAESEEKEPGVLQEEHADERERRIEIGGGRICMGGYFALTFTY